MGHKRIQDFQVDIQKRLENTGPGSRVQLESYLSNIRNNSANSSSDFPLLSSFMQRTIITRNSSKSTVPLPTNINMTVLMTNVYKLGIESYTVLIKPYIPHWPGSPRARFLPPSSLQISLPKITDLHAHNALQCNELWAFAECSSSDMPKIGMLGLKWFS